MAKKPLPTPDELRQLLRYEPETGKLFWRERNRTYFQSTTPAGKVRLWNEMNAGREAFTSVDWSGHMYGRILGRHFSTHRVAWAIYYGAWPSGVIDHINGDPTDNRINNLRDVTPLENSRNGPLAPKNTSGVTGVYFNKKSQKWRAYIGLKNKQVNLGMFEDFETAAEARKRAEKELGYHPNHGSRPAVSQWLNR